VGMTRVGGIFSGCLIGDDAASEMIGVSDTMDDVTRGWTIGRGATIGYSDRRWGDDRHDWRDGVQYDGADERRCDDGYG